MTGTWSNSGHDRHSGFTLIEVLVVLLITTIIATIAGNALISLSSTASRTDSMVQEEQTASTVLAQLTEDIRSAVAISFPSGTSPSSELELTVIGTSLCSSGTTTTTTGGVTYKTVLWVVGSTGTLTREQQNSSCAFIQSPLQLNYLVNTASEPVFSYSDDQGEPVPLPTATPAPVTPLASSWNSLIASQASAVSVNLYVSTVIRGVPTYHTTSVAALTNQLQTLNPPGEGT